MSRLLSFCAFAAVSAVCASAVAWLAQDPWSLPWFLVGPWFVAIVVATFGVIIGVIGMGFACFEDDYLLSGSESEEEATHD